MTDLRIHWLEERDAGRVRTEEELRNKVTALSEKAATLEERSRNQEKSADRGWNLGQAVIVSLISIIGGALLSLLVQFAVKK